MNVITTKSTSLLSLSLLCALFSVAALPSMADNYSYWNAHVDSNWSTPENWNSGVPDEITFAQFGSPYETPYTITVDGITKVLGFYVSGSRTADLTFTGAGSFETYRNSEVVVPNGGSCHLTFDVSVTNASSSAQTILGNNTFKKDLYIGPSYDFYIGNSGGNPGAVLLEDNANLTALGLSIYADSSLTMVGSSVLNLMGDSTLKVYKNKSALSLSDNAVFNGKYLKVYDGASATISDNAQVNLTREFTVSAGASATISDNAQVNLIRDLTVSPGGSLVVAGNPTINLRKLTLPFSPDAGVNEEWTMNGGTFCATNDGNYQLYLPYTNGVKTLSGSGTFHLYRFYTSYASNLVLRLNGPNAYLRQLSGGDITVSVGNGSTLGAWGADLTLYSSSSGKTLKTIIDGEATFDTTDYQDGVTGRTLTIGDLDDCVGNLTVKGVGTAKFGLSKWSVAMPNVSLVLQDSVKANVGYSSSSGALNDIPIYSLGAFTMKGSSSFDGYYLGHTSNPVGAVESFSMEDDAFFTVKRHMLISGNATFSGNARAVIRNEESASTPFSCSNLSLSDDASLVVTGKVAAAALSLSDNASLVVMGQASATAVSLSGNASLAVAGQLVAESLAVSGDAHLAFTAGTAFTAGATFGDGNWTMEITIPSGYEAGIRPIVKGVVFGDDFANHVTIVGETTDWSVQVIDGVPVLYKAIDPAGIEWIGKSTTSDDWSDAANWNEGNVPTAGDIVAFGGLDRPTPYNDSFGTVSGLVFRTSAGPFTLSGAEALTLTAASSGRGNTTADNASIVSHSAFDQTISSFINFANGYCGVISDGGGVLKLTGGFNAPNKWRCFVVGGDVRINGDCSVGYFSFKTSTTGKPSCLTVLPGCKFTIRNQYFRGLVENTSYIGHFVVEEGGEMTVTDGDCVFWHGELENVIDGTLSIKSNENSGRLVGGPNEQYYTGKGSIYAASARSGRTADVANHYINFGGTLKLYMDGDWYTATYMSNSDGLMQDPNYPTRFRMKDGTTLGATADWTYGPASDAYDVIANALTPDARASIMVGTVTVDTQNPTNDTAYTITFVDPLDASAANVVKVGAGSLVFNPTNGCPSQVSNLTVNAGTVLFKGDSSPTVGGVVANAGTVRFDVGPVLGDMTISNGATASFAATPTLSGSLTIASTDANFCVDGVADTAAWEPLAAAADIVGPNSETKWKTADGMRRFKIVSDVDGEVLYGAQASGFTVILR